MLEKLLGYFAPETTRDADRRTAQRKAVYWRATIYPIDVFSDARIRDVSATGARGEADVELAVGQTLHVTLDGDTYHTGRIKWTLSRQFGLELPDAAAIFGAAPAAVDHGSREGHHPRAPRVRIDVAARLVGGRPPRPAIVRNVSNGGMLLDSGPGIGPGQHLVVRVGNAAPIYARVQWSGAGLIGIRAQRPLAPAALVGTGD